MKAFVLTTLKQSVRAEDRPSPQPGPGQVRIRIRASGVCGTDIHVWAGELPVPLPLVLGHEPVGAIDAVGPGVTSLRVGDRVGVSWFQAAPLFCGGVLGHERLMNTMLNLLFAALLFVTPGFGADRPAPIEPAAGAPARDPVASGPEAAIPSTSPPSDRPPDTRDGEAYARDAFRFCALLEAWPGEDRAETSRLLAEAFVEPLQRHAPELSKERLRDLAIEFEPRIVMAFQNLAAATLREHFTHDELRELIRFYETPLGRKYARVYLQWKDKIAAGDAERQKVAEELMARVRPRGTAAER